MIVQSLNALANSVKLNAFIYSAGLITTPKRKSCAEMGRRLSVSHDKLNRALNLKDDAVQAISSILMLLLADGRYLRKVG